MSAQIYSFKQPNDQLNMAPKGTLLGNLMERADIKPSNEDQTPDFTSTQSWDKVTHISQAVSQMLVDVAMEINECIRTLNTANISNKEVAITIQGLKNDLASFTDKIVQLKSKHADKAGVVANTDEYSECMSIGLEYMSLNEEIRALMFQPLTTLTEYANEALQKLSAQNPNVVTDVVPKEVA